MCWLCLSILCLGLVDAGDAGSGVVSETVRDEVEVFTEPSATGYITATLASGARVVVLEVLGNGWLKIKPAADSFDWIDERDLQIQANGKGKVVTDQAEVRAGRHDARMLGPRVLYLKRGDPVESLPLPKLSIQTARGRSIWVPIRPPAGDRRYVREAAVRPTPKRSVVSDPMVRQVQKEDGLPPDVLNELIRIDASARSVLREPLERWELEPVLKRYEDLLKTTTDPTAQSVLNDRIRQTRERVELARTARTFATLMKTSRKRDHDLEQVRDAIARMKQKEAESYVATGLVQPSSKEIDGRRLHVLIGENGTATAYLDIPPGIDLGPVMTRRVGVRGRLRYDERLNARVIVVRDIDPLQRSD